MKKQIIKYGLYAFSSLMSVILLINAYYSFFVEHVVGVVGFIAFAVAGVLCIPFVFIAVAKHSKITREEVLKIAVLLWLIGIFSPLLGL